MLQTRIIILSISCWIYNSYTVILYVFVTSINKVHTFRHSSNGYLLEILMTWLLLSWLREKRTNDPEGFPNPSRALRDKFNLWPGHPLTRLLLMTSLTESITKECLWLYESWNVEFLLSCCNKRFQDYDNEKTLFGDNSMDIKAKSYGTYRL